MAIDWLRGGGRWVAVAAGLLLTLAKSRLAKKQTAGDPLGSELRSQLVWTGPGATDSHQDTRRVYEDLFTSPKQSLWVVSYAYRDGPRRLWQTCKAP